VLSWLVILDAGSNPIPKSSFAFESQFLSELSVSLLHFSVL
jgi:hypothetical protein